MAQKQRSKRRQLHIDPAHEELGIYEGKGDTQQLTWDIWSEKYRWGDEAHPHDSMRRVVEGVYARDEDKEAKWDALTAMTKGLWIPGGRIQAASGTTKVVTMLNCFVCQTIPDAMTGIADALKDAMITQQQGGGIGMDFSTLRPSGAHLTRTGAVASGPLPFMEMWDAMCKTIMSAGSRRGAMMATMNIEHPDLPKFIEAKAQKGRLTSFNVSILVTDAFMDALEHDEDWYLGFGVPRSDGKHLFMTERDDEYHQGPWYAYSKWKAKDLWDLIIKHTYEYSEPGVIFIDRINDGNNLKYCENIQCTNPCGEQPLPPNGCCNLGAVNLARMVQKPFQNDAEFDFTLLKSVVDIGVRFLDNVIDTTGYPLEAQEAEELAKRRIGVGITGLANALHELSLAYGSPEGNLVTSGIMETIRNAAYRTSALLARDRGAFPLYEKEKWGQTALVKDLPSHTKRLIRQHGIRNGVLLTIAPTGTTSIYAGNVSSGLEPVFLTHMRRKVRQVNNDDIAAEEYAEYTVCDYGYLLYSHVQGLKPDGTWEPPTYMNTHADLTVDQHLSVQRICQDNIDASISKTINCPEDIDYEEFKAVYMEAYAQGCKGCTTYRLSDVRGSILSDPEDSASTDIATSFTPEKRPDVLSGRTYKIKWPNEEANYYITINEIANRPFELFIQSTSSKYTDWTTALSLMISAIMRRGDDISFIPEELRKVVSVNDIGWVDGQFYGSLVALIGDTIGKHLDNGNDDETQAWNVALVVEPPTKTLGEFCPSCGQPTLHPEEGCLKCRNCGWSNCI